MAKRGNQPRAEPVAGVPLSEDKQRGAGGRLGGRWLFWSHAVACGSGGVAWQLSVQSGGCRRRGSAKLGRR